MMVIDGSFGEGGGQILRTSLSLALLTGTAFRLEKIRAKRKNPGLLRQHLTAVEAAVAVGHAEVSGATIGSPELSFKPNAIRGGNYRFAVGSAGSVTLVLQTVLPALLLADQPSTLVLEGGTHNPFAPPYDYVAQVFLPLLERMGATVSLQLERYGFYPAGGGKFAVTIEPCAQLKRLDLMKRGKLLSQSARAIVANLPRHIGERELQTVRRKMAWQDAALEVEETRNANGAGNVLMIELAYEKVTEIFTAFGEKNVRAEVVAERAAKEAREYLQTEAPVGEHLADQLLLPMAMGEGGSLVTVKPSLHTTTNIAVIKKFLEVEIIAEEMAGQMWRIDVLPQA
ncbi:MAG: RNA 3'-terminal phosphate cyclase [Acidobacteria bacterium]|nr:RNA 3'-terminal phosphate cyclase [Acidobacteriota bacterium]